MTLQRISISVLGALLVVPACVQPPAAPTATGAKGHASDAHQLPPVGPGPTIDSSPGAPCPPDLADQRPTTPDALDESLALVGMRRADLGWRPKGWWSRFPGNIPYKLRHFDDLLAEPLATVTFTRMMGNAARRHLDPEALTEPAEKSDGHLYQAVHALGIEPMFGAFRSYSCNLTAEPAPLDQAILELIRAAGRPTEFVTFGDASPYPTPVEDLAAAVQVIPADARPILGRLVLNIIDAHRWAELAFRNAPLELRVAVARRFNLGEEEVDALDYCPEVDDLARTWDQASLWYAGLKCVQALDDTRLALADLPPAPPFAFDWRTPWGWIRLRGGGDDRLDAHDALLVVDLGGDDCYRGPVAASAPDRLISLLLDLTGNDHYTAGAGVPAQGAGLCGVGILLDAAGHDQYKAEQLAQGVGQFGLGVCLDLAGADDYFVRYSGQGCGYFGVGLLLDAAGHDGYTLHAEGQGFGGAAGVGVLADRNGNDEYEAVRDSQITRRPSYHSPDENISVSNAQGCAMGRRGDGADGHSWAGGLGALIDIDGDDTYTSGNWSQGTGYWFGTGLLYDAAGDDEYHGVCWSQGTGAHFCIGALIDEGGDDVHAAEDTSTLSLALGHDFTVALLVNLGGDDRYSIVKDGLAQARNRSVAMLLDVGGDDEYVCNEESRPGSAVNDEKFRGRGGVSTYFADTTSLGLFLDVGGDDSYTPPRENNSTWLDPADSPNWADRNFGLGVDRPDGQVSLLPIPEKLPSGNRETTDEHR